MNKEVLIKILDDAEQILQKNQILTHGFKNSINEQLHEIEDFKAKILFVGGFSAGKTALINTFLGEEEILEENITPETAIATELDFGTDEKIILIDKNGNQEVTSFDSIKSYSPQNYQKYIYVLNNVSLRDFPDVTLVDMPGFDSGIEAHNKAIMQYIDEAAAYIFVIDAENGTIGQSSLQFLNEIKNYSSFIRFILTKCDKLLPSDVEDVKQNVTEMLNNTVGSDINILVTSSRYDDAGDKIKNLIREFPTNKLMTEKLGGRIILILRQILQALQVQLESISFNSKDIELAIHDREKQKAQLEQNLKRQKHDIHLRMQNENVNQIIYDVENALKAQVTSLVIAAQAGREVFNEQVNSILRPVLVNSTQRNIEASYDELITSLTYQGTGDNVGNYTDTIGRTIGAFQNIVDMGAQFAKDQKFNKAFKVLSTVGAVTTNIIAPWMELVIIFLPEIIGAITKLFGQSKEEKIHDKIEHEVIPQICEKLRPEIRNSMTEVEATMIEDIEREFNIAIEGEIEALEQLNNEKSQQKINFAAKKSELEEDIQHINQMIVTIESALK